MIILISIVFYFIFNFGSGNESQGSILEKVLNQIKRNEILLLVIYFLLITYVLLNKWRDLAIDIPNREIIGILPFFVAIALYEKFFKLPSSLKRIVMVVASLMVSQYSWKIAVFLYLCNDIFEKKEISKIKNLMAMACLVVVFKSLQLSEYSILALLVIFFLDFLTFKKSDSNETPLPLLLFFLIEKSDIFYFKFMVLISILLYCLVIFKNSSKVNKLENEKSLLVISCYLAVMGFETIATQFLLLPLIYYALNTRKLSRLPLVTFLLVYIPMLYLNIYIIFEKKYAEPLLFTCLALTPLCFMIERIMNMEYLKRVKEFNYIEVLIFGVIISISPIIISQKMVYNQKFEQFIFGLSFFAMMALVVLVARLLHKKFENNICQLNIIIKNKLKF